MPRTAHSHARKPGRRAWQLTGRGTRWRAAGGEADEAATLAMLVTGGHLSEAQAASVGAAMARDGALLAVVRAHAQALDGARAARQILRRAGRTGR